MPHREWQQFKLPQVLNFKHNFHRDLKISLNINEEMLEDGAKFLCHNHWC